MLVRPSRSYGEREVSPIASLKLGSNHYFVIGHCIFISPYFSVALYVLSVGILGISFKLVGKFSGILAGNDLSFKEKELGK